MTATLINETADSLTLQIVIPFSRSMLEAENAICDALNEAGTLASANFLKRFDTDGERDCHRADNLNFQGNGA